MESSIRQIIEETSLEVPIISTQDLMEARPQHRNKILLIDFNEHQCLIQSMNNLPLVWKNFETVLLNVPRRLRTEELLIFGNLKGIFYQKQSAQTVAIGLQEIVNGQNWLPRSVCSQLLHYYRNVINTHTAPATVDLTIRELEVLRYAQSGTSNIQIAEALCISESTVKSHLSKIFKKLSVKGRVQAIAWADQNLLCQ
ncbi:helix-turn-helix transcriptional regulator [Vibrio sagamiensis NBRC 104589]|uniref:Helix-turn-helix transcriptional regulator n=2 Tax=Vibrio sagamiensis TaxID=512650 RepID=A0A511QF58_9VIBR|nr:helix-turn-helix transcriptional regulator [Vibrio sagamiensis NBRC 104589]